jgi:hypothetical protein
MEKITLPDGTEIFSTEHEQSPKERRRQLIEAQVRDFYESRFLLGNGKNPTTSREVQEKMRTEVEERIRQLEKSG